MRGRSFIFLGALVVLLKASCSKEGAEGQPCNQRTPVVEPFQSVIQPDSYLPAFPGSWWSYSDGRTITTSTDYELHAVLSSKWDTNHGLVGCCAERTLRLPVYDGYPLYRYTRMRYDATSVSDAVCAEVLLSESLGAEYFWGGSHYGRTKARTIAIDAQLIMASGATYSPCIVVKRVEGIAANYFDQTPRYTIEWFAKDIGLVRRVAHRPTNDSTVVDLVDYHIHH